MGVQTDKRAKRVVLTDEKFSIRAIRWWLKNYANEYHLRQKPPKKPELERLNSELDKYALQGFEDYEERKENG